MARFSKYNQPKRRKTDKSKFSQSYINDRKNEMYKLLAEAKTEEERDIIIKAFNLSI